MYNRKKGVTLIELIIAVAILSIVLTIIYSFFLADYKAINKAQVELELQSEGEKAIEKISNIAIQSSTMENIVANDIKFIKEKIEYKFMVMYETNENGDKKNKKLYLVIDDNDVDKIEIANYIERIAYNKIEQKSKIEQDGEIKEQNKIIGVEIAIKLEKNDIKKKINTKVYFRNVN